MLTNNFDDFVSIRNMIMGDEHIAALFVVISIVVIRVTVAGRRLLARSLADEVDIWVVVDFVVLEVGQLVHKVLQRLVGSHRLPFLRRLR